MARKPRIKIANQIYSIVTRINNSQYYFSDRQNAIAFLDHLKYIKNKLKFKLYGFVIMSTHVHLLIQPNDNEADISKIMKQINGNFAVMFNKKNKLKGHFWMERFKSKIVEDLKYLANTIIYFALNPVKAGITDNPLKYEFNSIRNIKDSNIFADLLDKLPEKYNSFIKKFLKREDFLILVDKLIRTAIIYSFNLKKSKKEQYYKNFIGKYSFIKNTHLFFQKNS